MSNILQEATKHNVNITIVNISDLISFSHRSSISGGRSSNSSSSSTCISTEISNPI